MQLAIGIVLYKPTQSEINNLLEKISFFENVIIYDNTPRKDDNECTLSFPSEVVYISDNKNNGLSLAYNEICKVAISKKCDYVLLLDQDSMFPNNKIQEMIQFIDCFKSKEKVGVFSPKIEFEHQVISESKSDYEEKEWVISSGSFINLNIYKETLGFDQFLFIDRVDYDYCKALRMMGYKIIQYNLVVLYQVLGCTKEKFGKKISEHSPQRVYFMCRNRFYINDKYYSLPIGLTKSTVATSIQVIRILIFESDKLNKLKKVYKGILDFMKYRFNRKRITDA